MRQRLFHFLKLYLLLFRTGELNFIMTLSSDEWSTMSATLSEYSSHDRISGKKRYTILKPYEWTTIITEHFYKLTKLSCCISYKQCKCYPAGTMFAKFKGMCTTCGSEIVGTIVDTPKENHRVLVHCSYSGNFRNCSGRQKRRIIGSTKEKYEQLLVK